MEPYASRHAGVVSAIRAIAWLESIKSKRAKHSIGGVDLSSHISEGWPPRLQSSGVLALRCRYLSHPRERSESIGYPFPGGMQSPPLPNSEQMATGRRFAKHTALHLHLQGCAPKTLQPYVDLRDAGLHPLAADPPGPSRPTPTSGRWRWGATPRRASISGTSLCGLPS